MFIVKDLVQIIPVYKNEGNFSQQFASFKKINRDFYFEGLKRTLTLESMFLFR